MKIEKYLSHQGLVAPGESCQEKFADLRFTEKQINQNDLSLNSQKALLEIREIWKQTGELFILHTNEIKSSGLKKIVENTLEEQAVTAAPGVFYFFKDNDLLEVFNYNLQKSKNGDNKQDLLVYLALARIKNEKILSVIPQIIHDDIKNFLGNNIRAIGESRKLLGALSDRKNLINYCEQSELGIQDDEAMWIHTALIKQLNPVLRVYIGCASFFYGDPETADIIKIHKKSSKVTFYLYDDFDNKHLPEMQDRIKVDLSSQKLDHFDHRSHSRPEVIYFKERFICKNDKNFLQWKKFSEHLASCGYSPEGIHIEQSKALAEIEMKYKKNIA